MTDDDQPPTSGDAADGWFVAGRYRVLGRLGRGAMADVFRAHDETLDRDVALKVFRTHVDPAHDPDGAANGAARRALELHTLAQLGHPNLVALFDGSVDGSSGDHEASFLALELIEGPSLSDVLRDGALPEPLVRVIGAQMADALAYVHEQGIVHRDVKPANILLGADGIAVDGAPGWTDPATVRARLGDFGIVRLVDSSHLTSVDLTVGTAYYLAPEQARSADVGPPADVYALGLVLVEALTGARSFEGPMHEVLLARLSAPPVIPDALPQPWPGLLRAMTAMDPAARPSAGQVARALQLGSTSDTIVPIADPGAATGILPAVAAASPAAYAAPAYVPAHADAMPEHPSGSRRRVDPDAGRPRRRVSGMLVAAAIAVAVILGGVGWLLVGNDAGSSGGTNGPQAGTSLTSSAAHTKGRTHAVDKTISSSSAPATRVRHRTRTSDAPTTSSAPITTSSAPTTSTAPTTTSGAPTTTSSAPTRTTTRTVTTTPTTTAPTSTSVTPTTTAPTTSPDSTSRSTRARVSSSASSSTAP